MTKVDRVALAGIPTASAPHMKLTDVYVDVNVRHEEAGSDADRPVVGTSHDTAGRRSLLTTLRRRRSKPAILLGEPGSGRSTALRRIAIESCRQPPGKRRTPILLELRHLTGRLTAGNPAGLAEIAAGAEWLDSQVPAEWFAGQLQRGRCMVMFDGLDEIASDTDRRAVSAWLRQQMERYPGNAYLITTRAAALRQHEIDDAEVWRLRPLTDVQIASFVYSWCQINRQRIGGHSAGWIRDETAAEAGVLVSRLRASTELYELSGMPMLLTLIAVIHRHCGILPHTRAGLYADACDVLLRWLGGDGGTDNAARLRGTQRHEALQRLAYHMMDHRRTTNTMEDARTLLGDMLRHSRPRRIPEAVLLEAADAGLLTRADTGDLAFGHLSLQEYLAARHLHETGDDGEVASKINDPWWRDVILLWAADADASRVVEACLRSGNLAGLALAYDAAEQSGNLSNEVQLKLKRMLTSATENLPASRLLGAVKASREMTATTRLRGGARLVSRPVSASLYAAFLAAEYPSRESDNGWFEADGAATGMWASDATHFVDWLNALPRNDGATFALPSESEVLDPMFDMDISGAPIWVDEQPHPRLASPDGATDPYALGEGWWQTSVADDRYRASLSLYLMAQSLGPSFRELARDLAGETDLDRQRAHRLPRELDTDTALRESRRYLRRCDLSHDGDQREELAAREHLGRIIDTVTSLSEDPEQYRGATSANPRQAVPFGFLKELTDEERRLLATSYVMLWFSRKPHQEKLRYRQALEWFDAYQSRLVFGANLDRARTVTPEQLLTSLRRAQRMVKAAPSSDNVLFTMSREVLSHVAELLNTGLVHSTSYTAATMRCARTAVLAVAAAAPAGEMSTTDTRRLVSQLGTVVAGLTVLERRATGKITPNETMVLVRK